MVEYNIESGSINKVEIDSEAPCPMGRIGHSMAIIKDNIYIH